MDFVHHPALQLVIRVIRSERKMFSYVLAMTAIVALVELLPPRLMAYFTEQLSHLGQLEHKVPLSDLDALEFIKLFFGFGMLVALVVLACHFVWELLQEAFFLRTESFLRRQSLEKLHEIPVSQLDKCYRGDFLTQMTQDLHATERFIAVTLPDQLRTGLVFIGVSITFVWYGGGLACFMLASAFLLAWANIAAQNKIRPIMEKLRTIHTRILQLLIENYEGLPTIRSLGAQSFVKDQFEAEVRTIVHRGFRLSALTSMLGGANGFLTGILTVFALCYVAWRVQQRDMDVKDALLYPFYIGLFYQSALSVLGISHAWSDFLVRGQRLAVFLNRTPTPLPVAKILPGKQISYVLRNIRVQHEGCDPLTQPFELKIKKGEILLIQGESGCGKSTLLQMLCGLRPFTHGHLATPQAGLHQSSEPWMMPCEFSLLVEQKPYLFEGTVRANLTMGQSYLHDQDLWTALAKVNLKTHVEKSGGLDHKLFDLGRNLSEGQKYRLVIARAILSQRQAYCFDEPFASLDLFSIRAVCDALDELRTRGDAVIIVSHTIPQHLEIDQVLDLNSYKIPPVSVPPTGRTVFESPRHENFL